MAEQPSIQRIADALPALAFVADSKGLNTFTNARYQSYTGLSAEALLGDGWMTALHPDESERVIAGWHNAVQQGLAYEVERRVRQQDGQYRWHLVRAEPVRDDDGEIFGWSGICTDIEDKKRNEIRLLEQIAHRRRTARALRNSEARFRALVNATTNVVYRLSPDWSVMEVLDDAGAVTQPRNSGRTWLDDYVPEEDQPLVREAIREAVENRKPFRLEHRARRVDGTLSWTYSRAIPLFNEKGELTEWFGAATDVTARKHAEEALRQSEATLNAILDTLPAAVVIADADGHIVRDNAHSRELWGIPPDIPSREAYEHWVAWWPDTGEPIQTHEWAMTKALQHGTVTLNELIRAQPFDREESRYCLNNVAPLKDSEGNIIGGVAAMLDVTDRILTEEALRESDRAKDEFLAVLGHELRNPLAPLRTGLDLMTRARRQPELLDRLQPMMERQLTHLVRLVDDLLDIARISRGEVHLKQSRMDVHRCIDAAVEQMQPLVNSRDHELRLHLASRPLTVEADAERLTQVFANLLSNAAKYTDPGGIIQLTTREEDGQAVIRVRDNGYGIPPDRFDRLFKLFSQIAEHRSRTGGGGLGIGLALSRRLIEMHGGTIDAWSDGEGQGSEFVVRLPLVRAEQPPGSGSDLGQTSEAPRRVLVVDDNADAAEGLRLLLESEGHLVRTAGDGPGALRQVETFHPEVVLLDLGLPTMDGIEVAHRMRRVAGAEQLRLVAVTGWGQERDRERTRAAGFDEHLIKPVEAADLKRLLAHLLHPA